MNHWLFALIATAILLLLFSRISLYVDFHFCRRSDDDYIAVTVYALRKFFIYSIKIPVIAMIQYDDLPWITSEIRTPLEGMSTHVGREQRFIKKIFHSPKNFFDFFRAAKQFISGYTYYINKLSQGVHCEKFELRTIYGFEDAAFTGMMMGVIGSLASIWVTSLHNRLVLEAKPVVFIQPVYGYSHMEIDLRCILRIRFGNVITATMSVLLNSLHGEATRSG